MPTTIINIIFINIFLFRKKSIKSKIIRGVNQPVLIDPLSVGEGRGCPSVSRETPEQLDRSIKTIDSAKCGSNFSWGTPTKNI